MGQLPEALADRSIPIILKPLTDFEARVERFNLSRAAQEAKPLQQQQIYFAPAPLPSFWRRAVADRIG